MPVRLDDTQERLFQIEQELNSVIDIGLIEESRIYNKKPEVRVNCGDGFITGWMPLLHLASDVCKVYVPPQKGEHVQLFTLLGSPGDGMAIRGMYYKDIPLPERVWKKAEGARPEDPDDPNLQKGPDAEKIVIEIPGHMYLSVNPNNGEAKLELKNNKSITINDKGDINLALEDITINNKNLTIDSNTFEVESNYIKLGVGQKKNFGGVVTHNCKCILTGSPHFEYSQTVKAAKDLVEKKVPPGQPHTTSVPVRDI